ncbi:MAG TPA: fused MFS/spermidine synthase, partial [Anaeromyxobacteraceae bacterium]|nr:fused MFS/spermidine synthase [Anaeromyxobacteraceae bacterium]
GGGRLATDVGEVLGANTIGGIGGALLAGFVLVPRVGIEATVSIAATASIVAGAAVMFSSPGSRSRAIVATLGAVQVAALLWLAPEWDRRIMTAGAAVYAADMLHEEDPDGALERHVSQREILFYREGVSATVAVLGFDTDRALSVNGKIDAGTAQDMATQLLLGHVPALLHGAPRRALVIGLGSGVTAGALSLHSAASIDVAEIEPAVVEAASWFDPENRGVLRNPRVRVLLDDGRHVLASAVRPYDVIASEPSNPWIAGEGSLFTREFFELARAHLAPGGVMTQWLHTYSISVDDLRMIIRTFQSVFPHATAWRASTGDVLLVGTAARLRIDVPTLLARIAALPQVRGDLDRTLHLAEALPWMLLLGEDGLRAFSAGAQLNTDDRPRLEFSAPLSLYAAVSERNMRALRAHRGGAELREMGVDASAAGTPVQRLALARALIEQEAFDDARELLDDSGDASAYPPPLLGERERLLAEIERRGGGAQRRPRPPGAGR